MTKLPKCAVIGAGTMGTHIAFSLALGGAEVAVWDRPEADLADSAKRAEQAFDFVVSEGLAKAENKEAVLKRISFTNDMKEAAGPAGFIIEAVLEDIGIKQAVLKQAEEFCSEDAILSSTTSALSATSIQAALNKPSRFCIAHYAQPAYLVKLVEVVPGEQTSEAVTEAVTQLLNDTDKTPVLCPDIPGFLWARIQHAVLREFVCLVDKGLVTPEACDTILKQGYASRLPAMGAFEHADLAGLDLISGDAAQAVWKDLYNVSDPHETSIGKLLKEGHTGMRSGQGFYNWKDRDPDQFKSNRDAEIVRRVKIQAGAKVMM
ncbi:3-hydroxybutyryl-CoA dehydrogenase [Pseudovibrio denitrificans]|uniref:3-hydroxybutyryl-CoA dehydrogenase n=1 Tax=Pseudovibrio denitrificans TaxID=258256 RepID=A0A1I7DSS7_9HYPH|nr:3-hydroxyacyl-CoA dehydrogenase family protein [Pseudovibrio denitrificans]SFU14712.1 3-hydroxybutyryl-CoA dehydrogenase [Pseudovibrio denitrificans]